MAEVVLDGVTKTFPGNVVAVADLHLTLADRELVVMVGPSGCGKTTTLRLISGLVDPTRGSIRFDGRPVDRRPPHERNVAMVCQHHTLYPQLTVFENLAFVLRRTRWRNRLRRSEIERRVVAVAERLGLRSLMDRRPRDLSGGERQRVALGRALVRRPDVFLLDEPLSGLEPPLRRELRRVIAGLRQEVRAPMLYVTHDQDEAIGLGDRVLVMNHGKLEQLGTGWDLVHRPVNRFVAEFIGMPPMNLLTGRIAHRDEAAWFEADQICLPVPASVAANCSRIARDSVLLGLRPGAIQCRANGGSGSQAVMSATVESSESLGGESYVTAVVGSRRVICRADAMMPWRCGQRVELVVDMNYCYVFDETGRNVTLGSGKSSLAG